MSNWITAPVGTNLEDAQAEAAAELVRRRATDAGDEALLFSILFGPVRS